MYHIAIVEDEAEFREQLKTYLMQYQKEQDIPLKISVFTDGEEILRDYQPIYDIILFDIEMPKVNGMDAAEQVRLKDSDVVLMFITNMANYALRGYEVGALDFVMKPITYYTFSMRFTSSIRDFFLPLTFPILIRCPSSSTCRIGLILASVPTKAVALLTLPPR